MNLSMRQLKAVLEVARLKSFTRAAEHLHITQQGLSLIIQEVEAQLDCRLFDRTTRTVSLTPAARQFLPAAEQAVRSLESAGTAIGKLSIHAKLTLSVAATPLVAATLLPQACATLRETHPDVAVHIVDVVRSEIQQVVEQGVADVGFGVFIKPTSSLERRLIFRCNLVCISNDGLNAKGNGMRRRPNMSWENLRGRPLLGLPADNPVQQLVDAHLMKSIGRDCDHRLTLRSLPTVLAMAEAGFGHAILPSFAVSAARSMDVDVALLTDPVVPVSFYQINQKGRSRVPPEEAFVKALLQIMKSRCSLDAD